MKLGIFARTYIRSSLNDVLDEILHQGFETVQFNLSSAGVATLPTNLEDGASRRILTEFQIHGLDMCAVSGTFNAIHPDRIQREQDTHKCRNLIKTAPLMGTRYVSLCTGTRNPVNMWRAHPDNDQPEAWRDLLLTLEGLLTSAEEADVKLGIEPEMANVINSAEKARKLLDEIKSPHLRIILDGANLLTRETIHQQREIFLKAFDLLGQDIFMVHAKDFPTSESQTQAAGKGSVDFPFYMGLVRSIEFNGPVVLHNLSEDEVPRSSAFIRGLMEM